jgi:predicted alpha-1,2-mannosidase
MKTRVIFLTGFLFLLCPAGCSDKTEEHVDPIDPAELVNPVIGTGGHYFGYGAGFPGACVPFGMAKPSPDTTTEHGAAEFHHFSGYHPDDDRIIGFSSVHIHGTGAAEYGALLLMPTSDFGPAKMAESEYQSRFSKETEQQEPGYYAVVLQDTDIQVEMTATERCAYHRYTFPAGAVEGHVIIDLSHALAGCEADEASVEIDPMSAEVAGSLLYHGSLTGRSGGVRLYFAARFNQQMDDWWTWADGVLTSKATTASGSSVGVAVVVNPDAPVIVQLGLSYVDLDGARGNLQAELHGKDFDTVREEAWLAWSSALGRATIQGGAENERIRFYTALYHAMLTPTTFTDADGRYTGFDKQIHQAGDFTYYTDFSMWDTYRTVHSLFSIIVPERERDMVISLLKMYEQGGHLPKWPAGTGYTGCMIGTPGDVVISDTYVKGITDFDVETAYEAIKHNATTLLPSGGRSRVDRYMELGYVPADEEGGSAAKTLEFATADGAISAFATALGREQDAEDFAERSRNYRHLFDAETGFMRGKNADGSWVEPTGEFDPLDWGASYYVEGTAWQYTFLVPHDPLGLMELFGSAAIMAEKLEAFFSTPEPDDPLKEFLPKVYYWQGNEPDIHSAYLFDAIGMPERTQYWVRNILETRYGDGPDGLAGNDDCGTLSSWYVFSSSGFYPIAGLDLYYIGSPLFEKVTFQMGEGRVFEILAQNVSASNLYIQSAELNGQPLNQPYFSHTEIREGGKLELVMGPEPSGWGQ